MITAEFKFLTKEESERLIGTIQNDKHRLIMLLMLDAGLRVTEVCELKLNDFDFKKRVVKVRSLKKRGKANLRYVPLSDRLYRHLGDHIHKMGGYAPDSYLFKTCSDSGHISRQSVWKFLKRYQRQAGVSDVSPHGLRHTFATHHLAQGTQLEEIKTMLGHQSYNTTLIYAQVSTDKLAERVNAVTSKPVPRWRKWFSLSRVKKAKLINLDFNETYYTIGRNEELARLKNNVQKGINTVVCGAIGVGKSHLLNVFECERKILRMDDTESIKKSMANILLHLYQDDKKAALEVLFKNKDRQEIQRQVQKETTINICDTIKASVKPLEYVLLIDDITKITPSGKKALERLKDVFVIICGARHIKAADASFLWNFERIDLKPLKRHFALSLINQLSSGLEVENWELYRNHIFNQTNGNPRAITELVERFKKEPFLTNEIVREVRHIGALAEIDMSWVVILFLGVVMATRYMAGELEEPALKFIGGCAMILLLMYRPLSQKLKRRFL